MTQIHSRRRHKRRGWLLPAFVASLAGFSLFCLVPTGRILHQSLPELLSMSFDTLLQEKQQEEDNVVIPGRMDEGPPETLSMRQVRPTIHVLGERHSGTKWITSHLEECFNHTAEIKNGLTRWKHWFQEPANYHYRPGTPSIVVAQFRHALQWVKAMQFDPYHSPNHFNLSWYDYVHREWTMPNIDDPQEVNTTNDICQYHFRPHQVTPCRNTAAIRVHNDRAVFPCYEMKHGGDGEPYQSIIDLRHDKIRNFLSIADYEEIDYLHVIQYEDMVVNGTAWLVQAIEKQLGVPAACQPSGPQALSYRALPYKYVNWMRDHVDWEMEERIGYRFEWDHNAYAKQSREYEFAANVKE